MIRTQIQFTESQIAELRHQARQRGVSISALVRDAVDRQLSRTETLDERWARALSAIGCGHSGGGNIARDHDEHLAEAYAEDLRSSS
jgi:hypothetical protein